MDKNKSKHDLSKGHIDWAFRIDGISKFFLDAKALKVDHDVGKWSVQATNYVNGIPK